VENVSYLAAFVAGLLSITSPCILPVVPLYVAYLLGSTERSARSRSTLLVNAAAFVIGFSVVFVLIGTAFGLVGTVMSERKTLLVQVGGLMLIVLGLHQIGLVQLPFLSRTVRMSGATGERATVVTSGLVGMTFAAGWTPCAGPILGAILTLALSAGDAGRATALLSVYSLGLAIPFLFIALAGASSQTLRRISQHSGTAGSLSGAVMMAVGIIMVLGIYQQVFARIVSIAPWTPIEPSLS
jgi:cytochrome c-type biogenesis protein